MLSHARKEAREDVFESGTGRSVSAICAAAADQDLPWKNWVQKSVALREMRLEEPIMMLLGIEHTLDMDG